jgi:hypothetical protein
MTLPRTFKGTKALLGFTRFDITAVMEMDAVNTPETREFYNTVWNELDAAAFPSPFTGENTTPSSRQSGYETAMARDC